tara:strand:- start:1388 stop:1627 length:240 start_codon:yes stop_codon:yes gene_type:complete
MHPLAPDLTTLSDDELQKKYNELNNRINAAYRIGNAYLVYQVGILLEDYRMEMGARQQKMMAELQKRTGKDFDDIINIQ